MDKITLQRFKAKIQVVGECWIWTGATVNKRYGKMKVYGETWLAHRLSYSHRYGCIPSGMTVDHKIEEGICNSSLCVRPSHLQLLTRSENNMKQHGSTTTHFACRHSKEDWNISSSRGCLICRREYLARYYQERKRSTR